MIIFFLKVPFFLTKLSQGSLFWSYWIIFKQYTLLFNISGKTCLRFMSYIFKVLKRFTYQPLNFAINIHQFFIFFFGNWTSLLECAFVSSHILHSIILTILWHFSSFWQYSVTPLPHFIHVFIMFTNLTYIFPFKRKI